MHLTWIPRELNEEADSLSNLDFANFDPEKRIPFDLKDFNWLVFHELIIATAAMFKSINDERERRKEHNSISKLVPKIPAIRGSKRLKWTDPW